MITGFNSIFDYARFCLAKSFRTNEDESHTAPFGYEKNILERFFDGVVTPTLGTSDQLMQNFTNPSFIVAATLAAVAGITFLFYPDESSAILFRVIPWSKSIEPWMIKCAGYIFSFATTTGVGMRAVARLSNEELMNAWRAGLIVPVLPGTVISTQPG